MLVFSSYLNSIEHKAPTHLRTRPLSLQNAGDARVPMGVITLFDWKNSSGNYINDVMIRPASSGTGIDRLPRTSKVLSGIATHTDSGWVDQLQQHLYTT